MITNRAALAAALLLAGAAPLLAQTAANPAAARAAAKARYGAWTAPGASISARAIRP